jgi:spore germination cell wall hydrolase CwlJ-like protein
MELAFGSERPDWNLAEFNVEETVNNPSVYANISKEEARKFNESLPFSPDIGSPARPFILAASNPTDRARALHCMSLAVYYEAGSESLNGQHAVAQVVINRMRHPAWPHSICGVVFQGSERSTGCQFTFTCDGALRKPPSGRRWRASQSVAYAALTGYVQADVGLATHYHTDWVAPKWAPSLKKLTKIGTHIFYTWKGKGGTPIAFTTSYAGKEAWPTKAAATAPELGVAEGEVLSAASAAAAALTQNPGDATGLQGTGSGNLATQAQELNQASSTARALARAESLASQQASADGVDTLEAAAPFALPEPGKDGLMPDPDISALIPKPKLAANQGIAQPKNSQNASSTTSLPQSRREAPKSRALDGL